MSVSSFTPALWQGRSNPSLFFAVGVVPQLLPCTPFRRQYQSSQRFSHLQTYNPNENTPHGIKTLFKSSSGPFSRTLPVQKLWKCHWMAPGATWLGTFTDYSQGTRHPRVLLASHFNLARGGTKPVVLDHYVDDRQHQPFRHYPGLKKSWLLAPPLDQRITCMKKPDAETSAKRRERALSLCLQRQQPQCPPHGLYSQSQKNALGPIILFLWLT